ncbi:hypothetical protein [Natronococcus occultus]|uniref:hypothetical protein n=1 Tax=Natronococcus occultus TaxID=29288 RepID=UPI000677B839|nr:hypothetical protein [Natronococcus occultus]
MSPTFTEDDIGKPVESATGESLGVVIAVDPGTAYVDPDANDTGSASTDDAVPLADDPVDRVTDESVRLEDGFQTESLATGVENAGGAGTPGGRLVCGGRARRCRGTRVARGGGES